MAEYPDDFSGRIARLPRPSKALEHNLDVLAVALELRPERGAAGDDVGQRFRFLVQRRDERLVPVVVAHELKRPARELALLQPQADQQSGPIAVHAAMPGVERQIAKAVEDR